MEFLLYISSFSFFLKCNDTITAVIFTWHVILEHLRRGEAEHVHFPGDFIVYVKDLWFLIALLFFFIPIALIVEPLSIYSFRITSKQGTWTKWLINIFTTV